MIRKLLAVACVTGLVVVAMQSGAAAAEPPNEDIVVKEERPFTGSFLRREAARVTSLFPLGKRYEELSSSELAIVHNWYDSLPPGDEPPYPLDGMKAVFAAAAKLQAKLLVRGKLTLIATVDATGQVGQLKAIGDVDPEMTRLAASLVAVTRFKPALCQGKPCKMDFPFVFNFDLH